MNTEGEIRLVVKEPHKAQYRVIDNRKRFNILACGRRWGKTTLVEYLIAEIMEEGLPIGYFTPTYKLQEQVWRDFKKTFEPIIVKKNESTRACQLKTGTWVEFWSMEDPKAGRSRKYRRVIIDEASMTDNLEECWTLAIRPTLIDYKGDAYLMSSPSSRDHFFYTLFERGADDKFIDYKAFQFPSWSNPIISKSEIEAMRGEYIGQEARFNREIGAEFVALEGDLFFKMYKSHINSKQAAYNPEFEKLHLAFDFNAKSTVVISQHYDYQEAKYFDIFPNKDRGGVMDIEVLHEDLTNCCEYIATHYANHVIYITGDSSGNNNTAYSETLFTIIQQKITEFVWQIHGFQAHLLFDIPTRNLGHIVSRQCFNTVLDYYGENYICDPVKCKILIDDYGRCKTDATGGLDKSDMNKKDYGHASDARRYGFHKFEREVILNKNIKI